MSYSLILNADCTLQRNPRVPIGQRPKQHHSAYRRYINPSRLPYQPKLHSCPSFSVEDRVPSLLVVCLETLARSEQIREVTKMLDNGPFTAISQGLEFLEQKRAFLKKIFRHLYVTHGYVYGGWIRDQIAGVTPHDIDIRADSLSKATRFIQTLRIFSNILVLRQCFLGCFTIIVQDPFNKNINFQMDVSYNNAFTNTNYDLDVNLLRTCKPDANCTSYSNVSLLNDNCDIDSVIRHCRQKEFVVLTPENKPVISHSRCWITTNISPEGNIVDYDIVYDGCYRVTRSDYYHCINRHTHEGQTLLKRIDKMKRRGWKCLNDDCLNPECILAPDNLVEAYDQYLENKRQYGLKLLRESHECQQVKKAVTEAARLVAKKESDARRAAKNIKQDVRTEKREKALDKKIRTILSKTQARTEVKQQDKTRQRKVTVRALRQDLETIRYGKKSKKCGSQVRKVKHKNRVFC